MSMSLAQASSGILGSKRERGTASGSLSWVSVVYAVAVSAGRCQGDPAAITAAYERQADPAVELRLEKAGVRLAYLLNGTLK